MSVQAKTEAEKMRHVPGIVFADGATGRRARVAGAGIEVFEIIQSYKSVAESWIRLKKVYHWLTDDQLRSALAYYEAYPEEIDERLAMSDDWTPGKTWEKYPFTKPTWRP